MRNRVSNELRRNSDDKMIFGVASGLADYFGIDVALMRVLFVVTAFVSGGLTLLAYLLLAILVPEEPMGNSRDRSSSSSSSSSSSESKSGDSSKLHSDDQKLVSRRRNLGGWIIVGLGVIILAGNVGFFTWLSFGRFWPILLIALGLALVFGVFKNQDQRD